MPLWQNRAPAEQPSCQKFFSPFFLKKKKNTDNLVETDLQGVTKWQISPVFTFCQKQKKRPSKESRSMVFITKDYLY